MDRHSHLNYSTNARATNVMLPDLARLVRVIPMVEDNFMFLFRFEDPALNDKFLYKPGQFAEITVIGTGEAPISISSTPTRKGVLEMCIRRMGRVTNALYNLPENSLVGIRGPYGNGYPVEEMKGHDVLIIAGGLGMAPLRSLLNFILDNRSQFGRVVLMYGTKSPDDVLFRDEMESLMRRTDLECLLTVEQAYQYPGAHPWRGKIGMVTELFQHVKDLNVQNTYAAVCGPPIFYKFVLDKLLKLNFSKDHILMSLERRMECGVGKCGHCAIGYKYTCIDGPIFSYWDIVNMPELIEF
ncbi:MAG: FAD/NAD(P)-binding protein [Bacteroidota bacterium]|nr:FAD/NAD(P)-binding protein [Bacteroidota bacterium]